MSRADSISVEAVWRVAAKSAVVSRVEPYAEPRRMKPCRESRRDGSISVQTVRRVSGVYKSHVECRMLRGMEFRRVKTCRFVESCREPCRRHSVQTLHASNEAVSRDASYEAKAHLSRWVQEDLDTSQLQAGKFSENRNREKDQEFPGLTEEQGTRRKAESEVNSGHD